MRSLQTIESSLQHARRRSDTDFFKQTNTIALLMQRYNMLCDLIRKKGFYETYIKYKEKELLKSIPVDFITADILDVELNHLAELEDYLAQQTDFQSDILKLEYLMNWWKVNYETLCIEIPFACKQVETYFDLVLQEHGLWEAIEDYLMSAPRFPQMDESSHYDDLLQVLAQFHQAFGELFGCQEANRFVKLVHSVRRGYAYWNMPIHPADQLVSALKSYEHSSQRIMDLEYKLQFLQAEQAIKEKEGCQLIETELLSNTQKIKEFQTARSCLLSYIQELDQFWRLKSQPVHEQCSDIPLNEVYEKSANTLFLQVSYWLLKREKRQMEHKDMPATVLEESMAGDYGCLNDHVNALIQARMPVSISAPRVAAHMYNIYQSSFSALDPILETRLMGPHTP